MTDPTPTRERRLRPTRFFVDTAGPEARRPVDVLLIALGVLVTLGALRADNHDNLDGAVRRVAESLPGWVVSLFDAAYLLGAAYTVVVVAVVVLTAPRRGRLPVTILVAVVAVVVGVLAAAWLSGSGLPDLNPRPVRAAAPTDFPTVRVAAVAAVLLALRPWVVGSYRRLHGLVVGAQCFAAWAIGIAGPTDVLGALGVGIAAAGVALVVVGSPGGHPNLGRVAASLGELDVPVDGLRFADHQPWGARLLRGTAADGRALEVKVYGRDAIDAHRAARWWRTILYRDQGAPGASRLQLVEHEALVTILADRAGVPVADVVTAADSNGDAILVLAADPRSLAVPADDAITDDDLGALWRAVARFHGAGLSHGQLTLEHASAGPEGPFLSDLVDGNVVADAAQQARDVATLLTSQARVVGADRAVDTALAGLGMDRVAAAQPYLQRAALPRSLRGASGLKATLTAVRDTITDRTGTPPPPPAEVARLNWRDLAQVALILVAAYALLSTLLDLDWNTVLDTWRHATWGWVLIGLVIAQVTAPVDALTTMSVVQTRLPLWPVTQLQYAIKTVGLAISATVGRAALNTSFLRRFGEGPAVAVTATALDSFASAVCNIVVMLLALLVANRGPDVQLSGPDNLDRILVLLVVILVVSVVLIAVVPKLRRHVVEMARSSWASLKVVTESPSRALLLFGSSLASLMVTAVALDCFVEGLQPSLSYGEVLFVVAAASTFASIVPVPGNVGVAEAALSAGLVAVGVDSGPAFAIAVTHRIATSYLPPVYGAWALRWLRKEEYID